MQFDTKKPRIQKNRGDKRVRDVRIMAGFLLVLPSV